MNARPLLVLAALAAASEPDSGKAMFERFKDGVREKFEDDPMGSTITTVLGAAYLFYRAEKGQNPKVTSFYDALSYVSTSLSVGYSDIFPKTAAGKAVSAVVQMYGPAMAAGIFETPGNKPDPRGKEITDRLDRIVAALEGSGPPTLRT